MARTTTPGKNASERSRGSSLASFLRRLLPAGKAPLSAGGRSRYARLAIECLEDRMLLSGSISGTVLNQLSGAPLASQVVYLDLNNDGQRDTRTTTIPASAPIISNSGLLSSFLAEFGAYGSALSVQGLPATFSDVAVTMSLTNNSPDPIPITLVSPQGQEIPNVPLLFIIMPGQTWSGIFDSNANYAPVSLAASPVPSGNYAPQQSFDSAQFGIAGSPTDGAWGLVFFGAPSDFTTPGSSLVINSWSLTFKTAEPSTQTDAAGAYAFTGLPAGAYRVNLDHSASDVVASPAGSGGSQSVTVVDGQTAGGVNFGLEPAADLTSVSFSLVAPATQWGHPVMVNFTLTNQGAGAAPAFDVGLYLSDTGTISATDSANDVLLDTGTQLDFAGLAAGASVSGSVTVTLPASPPSAGFVNFSADYLGFVIDPADSIPEEQPIQSNQGAGIDLALLGPTANTAIASGTGVQQDPSIAVDPTNPQHLVVAYLDYSLINTGYAGIGIAVSTDGGVNWSNTSIPLPAGFNQGAAAPTVAFDSNGNVYVSFMAATFLGPQPDLTNPDSSQRLDGFQANNGIFVVESMAGQGVISGLSWGTPVAVSENTYTGTPVPFEAFPDMAIDAVAGSPYQGQIYVTWSQFYPAGQFPGDPSSVSGSDVMFAVSPGASPHGVIAPFVTQQQDLSAGFYDDGSPSGAGTGLVTALKEPNLGDNDSGSPGKGFEEFSTVTVGAGGAVYVAAYAGAFFATWTSTDGGLSTGAPGSVVSGFTAPNYFNQTGYPFYSEGNIVVTDPSLTTYANPNLESPEPPTFDNFRTLPLREIVADPTRPGVVYALADSALDAASALGGNGINAAGVVLAVSTDFGQTWISSYTVGSETDAALLATVPVGALGSYVPVLNDENAGVYGGYYLQGQGQVDGAQAMPTMTVNAQGDVTVIWYDTRNDPAGANLEVWGTISTDGGQHFSANFQVSNTSFNPNYGAFTDAKGNTSFYLGDQIGVASSNNTAFAVWTDTRNGVQDGQEIFFSSFALTPTPAPPVDRFSPNYTLDTATDLGTVTAQQIFARLALAPGGSDEWFSLQAGASDLDVTATQASPDGTLQLELIDETTGAVLDAAVTNILDSTGNVIGQQLAFDGANQTDTYALDVHGTSNAGIAYTLTVQALTGDFGTQVEGSTSDTTVAAGSQNVYRLATAVQGTLQVTLALDVNDVGGNVNLSILGADGQTVLVADSPAGVGAGGSETLTVPVTQGDVVFLVVSGANLGADDNFTLSFVNLDQYESSGTQTLFLPTVGDPTSIAAADLQNNGSTDLLVTNTNTSDTLGVLMGNGDGTFQAESQYDVGPGQAGALSAGNRQVVVANLNGDGAPDVIVPDFRAGEVSVLLGNGNGAFQPQRIFNAVSDPDSMVAGAFVNGSADTDLVVLQNFPPGGGGVSSFAFLQGRGDGTFLPPVIYQTAFRNGANAMIAGDFTGNGNLDLIVVSKNSPFAEIFLGNGNGTFQPGQLFAIGENTYTVAAADLNGATYANGKPILDLITASTNSGNVYVQMGSAVDPGTFSAPQAFSALKPLPGNNVSVHALVVVNFTPPAGTTPPAGMSFGTQSIVVTAQPTNGQAAGEVILLPELLDGNGDYAGFGAPVALATIGTAGQIASGDFTNNGSTDLAVTDTGGVTLIYGAPLSLTPNATQSTARNLGSVGHLVTQPQAIVTGHEAAFFTYTVPTYVGTPLANETIDFSAQFQYTDTPGDPGLQFEVLDAQGNILGSGQRFRVSAPQGEALTLEVFGLPGGAPGFGAYTLDVDVLPQVVSVQAESPLPGGPLTSLVITLQGDRLDPASAQELVNYTVFVQTPTGATQINPISAVYAPDTNLGVVSDTVAPDFATAVRQTVTLLFADPLIEGASYQVELSANIKTADLNAQETSTLAGGSAFDGHPLVSAQGGTFALGSVIEIPSLTSSLLTLSAPGIFTSQVTAAPAPADLAAGTPFLTQMHDDLGATLNALLKAEGDNSTIPTALTAQILASFVPGWAANGGTTPYLIIWLDPVSIALADPTGARTTFSLQTNAVANKAPNTFLEVGGNVEVLVVAAVAGAYQLNVSDVTASARGGAILLNGDQVQTVGLTDAMRGGANQFQFDFPQGAKPPTTAENGGNVVASFLTNVLIEVFVAAVTGGSQLITTTFTELETTGADSGTAGQAGGQAVGGALPQATGNSVLGAVGELSQVVVRWAEGLMRPGGVEGAAEGLLDGVRAHPFFRAVLELGNRMNRPQQQQQPQQDPPCGEETLEPNAAAPEGENAERFRVEPAVDAAPAEAAQAAPIDAAQQPVRRLNGLLVAGLLGIGAAFGLAFEFNDEARKQPKTPRAGSGRQP